MSVNLDAQLHKAVLVGVAHAPLNQDFGLPEAAIGLQESIAALPPEASLWQTIAVHDLWQRAGFVPGMTDPAPAAEEDERVCPSSVEQVLGLLLRGLHPHLLESWLRQAHAHGLRVPHAHLPAMLDLGMHKAPLRAALMPLLDKRGKWLVAQNPLWAERYGIAGEDINVQWNVGNPVERACALRAMREADPARALSALQAEWANELPESRANLLPCLEVKLSLNDEVFLESALDDKRKEVRTEAQTLLAALPGSQLVQRCIERLGSLVRFKKKFLLALQVDVELPQNCDKGMIRDGIGVKSQAKLGEKAAWLRDVVSRVPPGHWSQAWDVSPAAAISLMEKQEFGSALLSGVIEAAMRGVQCDPSAETVEWYCALLCEAVAGNIKFDVPVYLMNAFSYLSSTVQEEQVRRWLAISDTNWDAGNNMVDWIRQAANAANAPWPERISRLLLSRLQGGMIASAEKHWHLRSVLNDLANVIDVGGTEYFEESWPEADWPYWSQWRKDIDEFLAVLRFRHAMQRSFMEISA
jgi:hypothetical protein